MTLILISLLAGPADAEEQVILTSIAALRDMTTALLADTGIEVRNLPTRPRSLATLARYFQTRAEQHSEDFEAATAVVGMHRLWHADSLYGAARAANIRIVPIDATTYWSSNSEGVAIIDEPTGRTSGPSLYFWLSINNVLRSTDILAADLKRLFPNVAERIETNRRDFRSELLKLKREYDIKFASLTDTTVIALASEFVYLTSELTLFVDRYDVKQDGDWTDDDLASLENHVRSNGIRVAIHKWEPDERISRALRNGGADIVVLDTGELRSEGLVTILRSNLNLLHAALAADAVAGRTVYERECAMCHGDQLEGAEAGIALSGAAFIARWQQSGGAALSEKIHRQMPADIPDALSDSDKRNVLAFIREFNWKSSALSNP